MQAKGNTKLEFSPTRIENNFTRDKLTSYAGLTEIWEYINNTGLLWLLGKEFPTLATSNASKILDIQVFMSIVLANLSGINRLSHIEKFTKDPLMREILKREKGIDEDSFKLHLIHLGMSGAFRLQERLFDFTQKSVKKCGLSRITIDCDSTEEEVFGHQEGAEKGYSPKNKGAKIYHPLLCFISEMKLIVNSWFRVGNVYTANGIVAFIKQTLAMLPKSVKKIFFRADSGFFNGQLFDFLEDNKHEYLVKAKLTHPIKHILRDQKWNEIDSRFSVCEFEYQAQSWTKSRKLCAVRWVKEWVEVENELFRTIDKVPVYEYFVYCTNLKGLSVMQIHALYGERAESENWIEHAKNQSLASKTRTNDFWVNDILWQLGVLAYNISVLIRYDSDYKVWREEPKTFREWFICVPGKVVKSGRKTIVKMSQHYMYAERWRRFSEKIPLRKAA
jgi:hypothetical protein